VFSIFATLVNSWSKNEGLSSSFCSFCFCFFFCFIVCCSCLLFNFVLFGLFLLRLHFVLFCSVSISSSLCSLCLCFCFCFIFILFFVLCLLHLLFLFNLIEHLLDGGESESSVIFRLKIILCQLFFLLCYIRYLRLENNTVCNCLKCNEGYILIQN